MTRYSLSIDKKDRQEAEELAWSWLQDCLGKCEQSDNMQHFEMIECIKGTECWKFRFEKQ